jgi:two-component system sensor histidine kinase KdpD
MRLIGRSLDCIFDRPFEQQDVEDEIMSSKFAYPDFMNYFDVRRWLNSASYGNPVIRRTRGITDSSYVTKHLSRALLLSGHAAGLGAVVLITAFYWYGPAVNRTTVGFTYLLAVLWASALLNPGVSIFMSVAAALAYDYFFLPPVGTLNIDDPQDWVALSAFLVTAVVGGYLSTRARQQAEVATGRRREIERLYEFSQRLLSAGNPIELFNAIPQHIVESFKIGAAALFLADKQKVFYSGTDITHLDVEYLRDVVANRSLRIEGDQSVCFVPLCLGTQVVGSIGISGPAPSRETLEAMGTLVAVAMDRARAIEHAAKVEAMRESERLKSVLMDAITHDFRTPLTSIKVSATALLDDLEFNREQRKELLVIIDEECDRINGLVGDASEMARLESGEMKLNLASHSVEELISAALADCKAVTRDRPVSLDAKHQELPILVDLSLAKKVLVHLITNAHLYSSPEQPITITTERRGRSQFISVADQGPGIDEMEISRIFEKFYRGKDQRYRVQGTGMGLPIAKAIVETHGGTLSVVSRVGHGSVFSFSLPLEP